MINPRRLISLLAAVLLVALAATSIAVAAKPGRWADSKRKLEFGITQDRKHFDHFDWTCKDTTLATGFNAGKRPKIRKGGRFEFKFRALPFKNGGPGDPVRVKMKGRFVRRNGKTRAVGTVKSRVCGKKAKSFRAKWAPAAEG
jgi:opacity protein-like surface antigen